MPVRDALAGLGRLRLAEELLVVAPGLLVAAVLVAWANDGGGFSPLAWYPGAILLLALLVVVASCGGSLWRRTRGAARVSLLLFAAFTAWSFLSIAWAGDRGVAWEGANRTLLYLVVYLLAARWRLGSRAAAATVAALAVGVAGVGVVTLWQVAHAAHPQAYFIGSRLVAPTGYPNATAALYVLLLWPALCLASRRETPTLLRGPALALAGLLLQLSLIPESRGSLFSLPVVALLYLALVPGRGRSLLGLALVALATAPTLPRLLDVYRTADRGGDVAHAVRSAGAAMALAFLASLAAGTVVGALDRRLELSPRAIGRVNVALAGTAVLAALVGVVAAATLVRSPAGSAATAWHSFRSDAEPQGSSHFAGLGSHRYDFWRVAFHDFEAHPIGGIGVDNFAAGYLRRGRSDEQPLYPHSIELRLLGETGAVGMLLFVGALAAAALAAMRRRRAASPFAGALAGAALVAVAYWLVHGSADWLWEFPVLGGAAFALLGIATGLGARDDEAPLRRRLPRPFRVSAAAVAAGAALLSFGAPWAAARDVSAAESGWRGDPAAAYARLREAARLNPLSDDADVAAGLIAAELGDRPRAASAFERAVARNRSNWFAWLELGLAQAGLTDGMAAARSSAEAVKLDPRDPVVRLAARSIERGAPIAQQRLDRLLVRRAERTIGSAGQ